MKTRLISRLHLVVLAVTMIGAPVTLLADRPSAPHLLPDNTLAYVRIASVPDLLTRSGETSGGRMWADPQLKPLVSQLYKAVAEAYQMIEDRVGLSLEKLLAIPQGEVCVAIVAPEEGPPQLVALLDVGERLSDAEVLLERLEEELVNRGAARTQERVGDLELTVLDPQGPQNRKLVLLEKDRVVAISSDVELAKQLVSVWKGDREVKTLAQNRHFTTIMNRCRGDSEDPPQMTWYVNPIDLVESAGRGNFSAQTALAILSGLGLDGLQAVGGSMTMLTDEFDSVGHMHILLKAPREGVVKLVALDTGPTTPETWVPRDVATYMTAHWDFAQTYSEGSRLYDVFRGEGAWEHDIEKQVWDRLGVDFEKDLVDALDGRVTLIQWMERPVRVNSQTTLVGVKLKDAAAFGRTLDRVFERSNVPFQKETYGGVSYYRLEAQNRNQRIDTETMRIPEPSVAILGDYLVVSDSSKCLQQAIITKSDSSQSLANELDYKLIASRISRKLGDAKASFVIFSRPEEGLRLVYEMANSPALRSQLRNAGESNPALRVFRVLDDALNDNPLPPFAVLAQYLVPTGAMMTNDETGIHYMEFSLRRD